MQGIAAGLAFMDVLDIIPQSTESFDMETTGLTIVVMAGVYGVTVFFNILYWRAAKRLNWALNSYAA